MGRFTHCHGLQAPLCNMRSHTIHSATLTHIQDSRTSRTATHTHTPRDTVEPYGINSARAYQKKRHDGAFFHTFVQLSLHRDLVLTNPLSKNRYLPTRYR